jgi:hypothetical protein
VSQDEENVVYALIKTSEFARIFDRAPDDDVAAEAIYQDELNRRLGVYGITVLAVEMPDNPIGSLIDKARDVGLTEGAP